MSTTSAPLPSNVHISTHPCVRAKLSQLRSQSTNARETKTLVHEIATIIGVEALAQNLQSIETDEIDRSPLGYTYNTTTTSPHRISLIPILRSGLSMLDPIASLLPYAVPVHHLGMYREKSTLQPVEYYNNLPYHTPPQTNPVNTTNPTTSTSAEAQLPDLAILLDPIIATGATAAAAIDTLRDWGCTRILALAVLGSMEGLRRAAEVWPEGVEIWCAGFDGGGSDGGLDERGMIRPGVGDMGDRLFLTRGKG